MPTTDVDVKELRAALGLTQSEMGRLLGVEPTSVARWAAGAPPGGAPRAILRALEAFVKREPEIAKRLAARGADVGLRALLEELFDRWARGGSTP